MAEEGEPSGLHGRVSRNAADNPNDVEMVPLTSFGHEFGQPRVSAPARPNFFKRHVLKRIRTIVSQNRCRFKYQGLDLDLAYITDRIIAMGYPSESWEAAIRNSMEDTVDFLRRRHGIERVKVFNLRGNFFYDPKKFGNNVITFEMTDHHPPKLELMAPFCREAAQWLDEHPENVIAVHCKAGKGRTGVMICALLIFLKFYETPRQILDYYSIIRTKNNKGVTIPSQRRYIYYFARMRELELNYFPVRMQLIAIYLERPPRTKKNSRSCGPASCLKIKVSNMSSVVFNPPVMEISEAIWQADDNAWRGRSGFGPLTGQDVHYNPENKDELNIGKIVARRGYRFDVPTGQQVFVEGDVRVDLLSAKKKFGVAGPYEYGKIGHVWFNTMFASRCGLTRPDYDQGNQLMCRKMAPKTCNDCRFCDWNVKRDRTLFVYGDKEWPYVKSGDVQQTSIGLTQLKDGEQEFEYFENTDRVNPKLKDLKILKPPMLHCCGDAETKSSQPTIWAQYGMEEPHKEHARQLHDAHARGIVKDDYNIRDRAAREGEPVELAKADYNQEPFIGPMAIKFNYADHVLTFPVYEMDRALKDETLDDNLKIHVVLRCIDSNKEQWMEKSEAFTKATYEKSLENGPKAVAIAKKAGYPFTRIPEEQLHLHHGAVRQFPPAIRYSDDSGGYSGGPHPSLKRGHGWDWRSEDPRWCRYFYRQRANSRSEYRENWHRCWASDERYFHFPRPEGAETPARSIGDDSDDDKPPARTYADSQQLSTTPATSGSEMSRASAKKADLKKRKDRLSKSQVEPSSEECTPGAEAKRPLKHKRRQKGQLDEVSARAEDLVDPESDGDEPDCEDSDELENADDKDDVPEYRPLTVGFCDFSNLRKEDQEWTEEQNKQEADAGITDPLSENRDVRYDSSQDAMNYNTCTIVTGVGSEGGPPTADVDSLVKNVDKMNLNQQPE